MARKSLRGDGSIYQCNNKYGYWCAQYTPAPGAKRKYLYGKTEKEVQRKLLALKKSPETLLQTDPTKVSVKTYFNNWLTTYYKNTVKPATYDRTESVIHGTIVPRLGTYLISEITSDQIQRMINDLKSEGKSYSTIKKTYDVLKKIMRHAVLKKDITNDPMAVVACPSVSSFERKEIRALSQEEEKQLLLELDRKWESSQLPAYRYRDIYVLILNTGMRLGEVIALDWSDIDLDNKTISIHKDAIVVRERTSGGEATGKSTLIVQDTPKTSKANRKIPINATALEALRRLQAEANGCPFLVHTKTGKRTMTNTIYRQLCNAYQRCCISGTTVHTLRHTFATRLFERGATVKDVSELLGHASIAITANIYIHVIQERKGDIVKLLDPPDADGAYAHEM